MLRESHNARVNQTARRVFNHALFSSALRKEFHRNSSQPYRRKFLHFHAHLIVLTVVPNCLVGCVYFVEIVRCIENTWNSDAIEFPRDI